MLQVLCHFKIIFKGDEMEGTNFTQEGGNKGGYLLRNLDINRRIML
jgi:hypothetical protein